MFAKPNNRAFFVVSLFLFSKLDKRRTKLTFRQSGHRKQQSRDFRKHCCLWLREIAKQKDRGVPQVTPSTLICPGGAKFIHLVYKFARYVMIEKVKKLSEGTSIPFAEAVMRSPKNMYMVKARHRVAFNKLLQILQREDFVIQEYRKKAWALIGEIKRTNHRYAIKQKLSCWMKRNDQNKNDTTERIQKVRSMWTLVVGMLTSLKKEKEVVDSVLEDCVNPCILDGTDVVLNVPGLLTYSVESNLYGLCTGNLYEDGKLNFLTVIQLLNEALMMLTDENCPCELKGLHRIEDVVTSYKTTLQNLNAKILRREQQHCEPKRQSIFNKQKVWESKWKTVLGQCPFNLILKDYLQPAPSSQSSSSSDEDEDSVFCPSLSDNYDSPHEECHGKNEGTLETGTDTESVPSKSHFLSPLRISSLPSSEASEYEDLSIENNLHTETCVGNKQSVPPKILKNGKEEFPALEMEESAGDNVTQPKSPMKKDYFLEKARDELAEEIAKSVMCESPVSGEEKGMALDDLISSLSFNPFLTRKQIPRTPENLVTEIRSSWRKAIRTEGSADLELSSTEVMTEESSMDAASSMQKEVDSESASPVFDFDSSMSEKKSQLSSTESSLQEQVSVSHTFESSGSKTSGIQESESTESEELDHSALSESSVEDLSQTSQNVEKSMDIPYTCSKSGGRTNTLPSDHCRSFLMDKKLCWNESRLISICHETTDMGILDETLPECDSLDLSMSASSDSILCTTYSENVTDGSENKEDIKKSDLKSQSMSTSQEVLKKTASISEEELHQTDIEDRYESQRARLSTILEEGEESDSFMHEGCATMPLPDSPNESGCFLSPFLVSCQQIDGT